MSQREIEIKYLLRDQSDRNKLEKRLYEVFPAAQQTDHREVITIFFDQPTKSDLRAAAVSALDDDQLCELDAVINKCASIMVKARSTNDRVEFTVKGTEAIDDAVHAVNRIEFEVVVGSSLDELVSSLTSEGLHISSKFYADRYFYRLNPGVEMNIEFVSGYGNKAEIEIITDETDAAAGRIAEIRSVAKNLGLTEATTAEFGRMFAYYEQHWADYFDDRSVFSDEVWQQLEVNR